MVIMWDKLWLKKLMVIAIVILAIGTRFYQLTEVPVGLHDDEAAMAYDAFSLSFWRVNRQLMHLPVYLPNYGGGQSVLYAYLTAGTMRVAGVNKLAIRLPAAIFSLIAIFAGSMLVKEIYGEKKALLAAFLLTILPYFIMQGRFGLDCNLFLSMMILSLWLLLLALKKQKWYWWSISGLSFGITLYSYAMSWLIVPMVLLPIFIYLCFLKKINGKQILAFGVSFSLLIWPLILFVIINIFKLTPIFTRFFYIPQLNEFRGGEFFAGDGWANLLAAPREWLYVNSWDNYQSFLVGWTMYIASLPFLIIGIIQTVKKVIYAVKEKKFIGEILILLWFIAHLFLVFILDCRIHHHNGVFFPLAFFIIVGIIQVYSWCQGKRKKLFLWGLVIVYSLSFLIFLQRYFIDLPMRGYQFAFNDVPTPALEALDKWAKANSVVDQLQKKEIWIDNKYIFYYLGAQVSPFEVSPTLSVLNEVRYKNIHFEFLPKQEPVFDFIPKEIEPNDVYVISSTGDQDEYINELKTLGLQEIYQDKKWVVLLKSESFFEATITE